VLADIVIVRHGRTAWNQKERFRGLAEIELDETGIKQAAATANRLVRMPVSAIYSSPVRRAMQTASPIAAALNLTITKLPALSDIDFGELEGLTFEDAEKRYPDIYHQWFHESHLVKFPGGESYAEAKTRAANAVDKIIAGLEDETVVFVTHRVISHMLILHLLKLDDLQFRKIVQQECCIDIFQKQKGNIYAILINDTCHLRGIK
jgi:broad specificity phosphatase PhoE